MSRYCVKCSKAKSACICGWIKQIDTNIELIILQHPTEVKRPKGTAKILSLSLPNSHCLVGEDFSSHEQLNELLNDKNAKCYLLYPSQHAHEVTPEMANVDHSNQTIRIILLDGTWKKAYKIYKLSKNLQTIPSVCLPQDIVGDYRIRKAPNPNSLSTLEAGYQVLNILDAKGDFEPLIEAFNAMIELYIQQMPAGVYEKNYL